MATDKKCRTRARQPQSWPPPPWDTEEPLKLSHTIQLKGLIKSNSERRRSAEQNKDDGTISEGNGAHHKSRDTQRVGEE